MALSIKAFSIMTLSITIHKMRHSALLCSMSVMLSVIYAVYIQALYAGCLVQSVIMLR
jgi:hypothetical protein